MSLITWIPEYVEPADATVSRLITIHRRAPVTPFPAVASGAPIEPSPPEEGPAAKGRQRPFALPCACPTEKGVAER